MTWTLNNTANAIVSLDSGVVDQTSQVPTSFQSIGNTPTKPKSTFDSGNYVYPNYNGLDYKMDIFLDNSGSFDSKKKNQYFINPQAIISMSIVDSFNDWVVNGDITFMYVPEGLAETYKQQKDTGQTQKTETGEPKITSLKQYEFRGDGYDMLRIFLSPSPSSKQTSKNPNEGLEIKEGETKWQLSYLFSVYEIEDLSEDHPQMDKATSSVTRILRLKFRDIRYHILNTTNLEYSTANSPDAEVDYELANGVGPGNTPRVTYTGKAMLEVFNKAVADNDEVTKENTSLEFYQLPGDADWDNGESKLFYTSPASFTALEDFNYLYEHHVGPIIPNTTINDICMLHTKRSSFSGGLDKVCLTPLTKIFEQATSGNDAGSLQLEHFFVTNFTREEEDKNPASAQYKAPNPLTNPNVLKTFKYGQIVSYSFVDMSPDINSQGFTSAPVYSVDIGKRQFNIQFKDNDVLSARKAISSGYIKHLYKSKSASEEDLFLPIIHKTKKDRNIFPTYSLNGDNKIVRQKNSIHNLMYTGLFQNACICFKTLGLTLREPGTFIGIDKTLGTISNDFTNKLYGQYLVVRVDHNFEQGIYINTIWAIKIHRWEKREVELLQKD